MNTPRTDAAWSATFDGEQISAGRTARALRECSQQLETELAALTAERDQLRAELAAEREKVTMLLSDAYALTKNWHDRAERAEADAAAYLKRAESFRKIGDEAETELAKERARTKQIATALTDAISTYFGADKLVTAERIEAWQYAIKEDAK